MPATPKNGLDAQEFARLMARFDTGNSSEAEAMNAIRVLRRMVAEAGLRFVDVMGRADVKQALDAQMQPVREDSVELKEAFGKIAELADLLAKERELSAGLRQRLAGAPPAGQARTRRARADGGLVNGGLIAVTVLIVVMLLAGAAFR